jgi:hypothetical protein
MLDRLNKIADSIVDDIEAAESPPVLDVVTLDRCFAYLAKAKIQYPQAVGFVLSVKKNLEPVNDSDKLLIVQALIDGNNKPITLDGKTGISCIRHAKTIDGKMIDFLNGSETKIFKEDI